MWKRLCAGIALAASAACMVRPDVDVTRLPISQRYAEKRIFLEIYSYVRNNWDNFDKQAKRVKHFRLYDQPILGVYGGFAWEDDHAIDLYNSGSNVIVHELCHMTRFAMPVKYSERMSREWTQNISMEYEKTRRAGSSALSQEAAENFDQDVAVTCEFVFSLKTNQATDGFHIDRERLPGRVRILEKYGFISKKERDMAIAAIGKF